MKISIESTETITSIDGVRCRLWEGVTEKGIKCKVFVHRIAVHTDEDAEQFDKELHKKMPPGRFVLLREIL